MLNNLNIVKCITTLNQRNQALSKQFKVYERKETYKNAQ